MVQRGPKLQHNLFRKISIQRPHRCKATSNITRATKVIERGLLVVDVPNIRYWPVAGLAAEKSLPASDHTSSQPSTDCNTSFTSNAMHCISTLSLESKGRIPIPLEMVFSTYLLTYCQVFSWWQCSEIDQSQSIQSNLTYILSFLNCSMSNQMVPVSPQMGTVFC